MIDYVNTNRTKHPSQILDTRTLTSTNVGIEHRLVLCKYRSKHKPQKNIQLQYIEKINVKSSNDSSTTTLYQGRSNEKMTPNHILEEEDTAQMIRLK